MTPKTFTDILAEKNADLFNRLQDMKRRAQEEWVHLLKPDMGSHAGYVHLRNVERTADKMIPEKSKEHFSDGEIFLLLAAILLHDVGRIIPDEHLYTCPILDEKECVESGVWVKEVAARCQDVQIPGSAWEKCPIFRRAVDAGPISEECPYSEPPSPCPIPPPPRKPRKEQRTHHCKSRKLIEELWAVFGLPDEHIAHYCSLLAFWHGLDRPPSDHDDCPEVRHTLASFSDTSVEPYGHLRLPLLATILRLSDETENCWTRALREHWYRKHVHAKARITKGFRRFIEDVEFCHEAQCIVMHVPELQDDADWRDLEQSLAKTWESTCCVLNDWADHLAPSAEPFKHVFIEKAGRYLEPIVRDGRVQFRNDSPLGNAFSRPGSGQEVFCAEATMTRYREAILRLAHGTRGYREFSWSSIAAAVGEPIDGKGRWVIEQMGKSKGEEFELLSGKQTGAVTIKTKPKSGGQ